MTASLTSNVTRRNRTRYEPYWLTLNWRLPDGVLAEIWNVDRGNIRARRIRLGKGPPRWRLRRDHGHPVFLAAIALEKLKSKKFTGPRPAGPYLTSKGTKMSIPVQVSLELLRYGDEGEPAFCLTLDLLNANGKSLTAAIDVDYKWEHPTISNEVDFLGLQDHDRRALTLAAYEKMVRFHGAGPTGGVIQYSRWVVPDISDWVRRSQYHAAAGRILRTLRRLQPAGAMQAPIKEFTESVEA
jgi:hypothetical protein